MYACARILVLVTRSARLLFALELNLVDYSLLVLTFEKIIGGCFIMYLKRYLMDFTLVIKASSDLDRMCRCTAMCRTQCQRNAPRL